VTKDGSWPTAMAAHLKAIKGLPVILNNTTKMKVWLLFDRVELVLWNTEV
jgi:hypothetical protein